MECHFGHIEDGILQPSPIGRQAEILWLDIPKHFPQATLGEFIFMPNHLHGIINLSETRHGVSLPPECENQFGKSVSGSLSVIIGQYKASLTRWCRKQGYNHFAWQGRFYDHIIRNQHALSTIEAYIRNNPASWQQDRFYL